MFVFQGCNMFNIKTGSVVVSKNMMILHQPGQLYGFGTVQMTRIHGMSQPILSLNKKPPISTIKLTTSPKSYLWIWCLPKIGRFYNKHQKKTLSIPFTKNWVFPVPSHVNPLSPWRRVGYVVPLHQSSLQPSYLASHPSLGHAGHQLQELLTTPKYSTRLYNRDCGIFQLP